MKETFFAIFLALLLVALAFFTLLKANEDKVIKQSKEGQEAAAEYREKIAKMQAAENQPKKP
jgi:hypothetical protein